jgi:hypothetical protein
MVRDGLATLPAPGSGGTLQRWQALATVAGHDLGLAKLYEGHTDAVAILGEAGGSDEPGQQSWGVWAAEAPGARVTFSRDEEGRCTLDGVKAWCSGARGLDAGLLTVWHPDGRGPFLAAVRMNAQGITFDETHWQAVGMQASDSVDVRFDATPARLLGDNGFYLNRSGFWQGGAGIAACWYGGARALAEALRQQARTAGDDAGWHRLLALGTVDRALCATSALLREAAAWIDAHPHDDARACALRVRMAAEDTAQVVLRETTRALGAGPLCRDAWFARMAADLPVFVRQSHGDRDLAALGSHVTKAERTPWQL